MKSKKVVRYRQVTTRLLTGTETQNAYKETLVGVITGEAARILNEASERGDSLSHSYDTNNMDKRELWRSEILD